MRREKSELCFFDKQSSERAGEQAGGRSDNATEEGKKGGLGRCRGRQGSCNMGGREGRRLGHTQTAESLSIYAPPINRHEEKRVK